MPSTGLSLSDFLCAVPIHDLFGPKVFDQWYRRMPLQRREKIDRLRRREDQCRSLAAGMALNYALTKVKSQDRTDIIGSSRPEKTLDVAPGAIISDDHVLVKEQGGKPYIPDAGIFFNLSHAGDYAVCAVSDSEVGIDIEQPRQMTPSLAPYISRPEEVEAVWEWMRAKGLQGIPPENADECGHRSGQMHPDALLRLWTIKESVMKYYGCGLALSPKLIRIVHQNGSLQILPVPGLLYVLADKCAPGFVRPEKLHLTGYSLKDHPVTVCAAHAFGANRIEICK